jgi:hypothetical protein
MPFNLINRSVTLTEVKCGMHSHCCQSLLGVILLVKLSLFPSSNTASHSHEYLLSLMSAFFLTKVRGVWFDR